MAAVMIKIETAAGAAKVARILSALEPRTLLDLIGGRFLSYVDESFKTRGRGAWRPLSPLTLLLRKHGGDAPLQDSGAYKQAFTPVKTDSQTYVEVGSNRKTPSGLLLAEIHEHGTAPYTITARNAKVLAAQGSNGWIFFGKQVNHPGVPARPVLPTKAVAERLIRETVDAVFARVERPGA